MKSGRSWLGLEWEYHVFLCEGRLLYDGEIRSLTSKPVREVKLAKGFPWNIDRIQAIL